MATVVQKYSGATAVRTTYSSVYNTSAKGTDHTDNYIQQQGRYCSTGVHCFSRHTGRNCGGEGVGNHHFENHYSCCDGIIQLCDNHSQQDHNQQAGWYTGSGSNGQCEDHEYQYHCYQNYYTCGTGRTCDYHRLKW